MQSPLRTAFALLSTAVALTACTDQPASAPTAPNAPRVFVPRAASPLVLPSTCDPNTVKGYARDFVNKSNDPLLSTIGDIPSALRLDAAVQNGPVPGPNATDKVFDALAQVAAIRGTSNQNPAATGLNFDNLVRGLLKCAQAEVTLNAGEPEPPAPGIGFRPALGPNWVFEVRGKTVSPADPTGAAYERGSTDNTWWALWPKNGAWDTDIQSSPTDHRVLVYGYRTTAPVPAQLGSSFEHKTIPAVSKPAGPAHFTLAGTVGLCVGDQSSLQVTLNQRVNHANVFLPLPATPPTCAAPPDFTPTTGSIAFGNWNPARLARRVAGFFAPQSLYAATLFFGGSVTGSPDDFSPSSVYDLSQYQLSGLGAFADSRISRVLVETGTNSITVDVTVIGTSGPGTEKAPNGTPVVLSIYGNSSSIAFFSDNGAPPSATVTRYTQNGVATFSGVKLTKAGGYQLQFQVSFDGAAGPALLSNSFNMQNK